MQIFYIGYSFSCLLGQCYKYKNCQIQMFNYMGCSEQMVQEGVKKFDLAVGARKMIDLQYEHAVESIQSKVYITYWNKQKKSQCSRLGSSSKCFCGHSLQNHNHSYFGKKFNTSCAQKDCFCKNFKFVPSRPQQCGMYWLVRRKDFDITKWKPPCKCKHSTTQHQPYYPLKCKKCSCYNFDSNFACLTCDGLWQHHQVVYEMEQDRIQAKKPVNQQYLPLSTHKNIQQQVFKKQKYSRIPNKSLSTKQHEQQKQQIHKQMNWKRPTQKKKQFPSLNSPLGIILKPKYPDFMYKK